MTTSHDTVAALESIGLTYSYGATRVLTGLDLRIGRGEIYALLGGNGAGKSTTLSAFLGFIRPGSGTVRVCGHDVTRNPLKARDMMAYVPESVALYEHLSARENIDYFLGLAGAERTIGAISDALDAVGLNAADWDRRVAGFSKGMRQKVAIALAVARKVPVLLLDEPTSGLDPHAIGEFNGLLEALRQDGVSTLMVTHDLLSAADVADRIGFLAQGKLIAEHVASGDDRFDVRQLHRHYATGGTAV